PQVPSAGKTFSVVLHTKGYYEHVRDYKGKPQLAFLKGFRNPGAFPAFSLQQYGTMKKMQPLVLSQ
ncbi:MAG TPA: hypothetical protein VFZ78_09735, partial [Flavisolibacter sp.]